MKRIATLAAVEAVRVAVDVVEALMQTVETPRGRSCRNHPITVRIMAGVWKCTRCGDLIEMVEKAPAPVEVRRRARSRLTAFGGDE